MRKSITAAILFASILGCRDSSRWEPTPRRPEPRSTLAENRTDAETIRQFALDIRDARDGLAEADAIKRLRDWEIRNGLTYQASTIRTDTHQPVPAGTRDVPLETQVTIFRGRDTLGLFSFIPKDPRNLALLGQ